MDLDAISEVLSVSKAVLQKLRDVVNEDFHSYIEQKKNDSFWDKVDSLPPEVACELHLLQLQTATTSKDFAGDCLSPSLENFYFANNSSNNEKEIQFSAQIENKQPQGEAGNLEWFEARLSSLCEEGFKPIQEQKNYALTPSILAARSGLYESSAPSSDFEQASLSELLFTNSFDGTVYPLPFTNATSDIPKNQSQNFVRNAVKKFVAQTLMDFKYKSSSTIALDILTDVVLYNLHEINYYSTVKYNSSHHPSSGQSKPPNARSVILQSLRCCRK